MYNVYFLESEQSGKYYIGVSRSADKRLREHNEGLSKSTAPWRPWRLVRIETYKTIKEAYKRERFLKSKKNKKVINRIVRSSPDVRQRRSRDPDSRRKSEHRDSVG